MANKPFGYELFLDMYHCDPHVIDDINVVYNFLEEAVHALGVSRQAPPFVFRTPAEFASKAGISSWVPLVESGISCHTLVIGAAVFINYFTCSVINRPAKKKLVELAKRHFRPTKIKSHLLKRGEEYYDEQIG